MKKTIVILLSLITSFIIMTAGYGYWTEELTIIGDLKLKEDPKVIAKLKEALSKEQDILAEQNRQLSAIQSRLQALYQLALEEKQQQATETVEAPDNNETQNTDNLDTVQIDVPEEKNKEPSIEENTDSYETVTEAPVHNEDMDYNDIDVDTDNSTNNIIDEITDTQPEQDTSIEQGIINTDND